MHCRNSTNPDSIFHFMCTFISGEVQFQSFRHTAHNGLSILKQLSLLTRYKFEARRLLEYHAHLFLDTAGEFINCLSLIKILNQFRLYDTCTWFIIQKCYLNLSGVNQDVMGFFNQGNEQGKRVAFCKTKSLMIPKSQNEDFFIKKH